MSCRPVKVPNLLPDPPDSPGRIPIDGPTIQIGTGPTAAPRAGVEKGGGNRSDETEPAPPIDHGVRTPESGPGDDAI